ncbi:DNA polymerase III subunit delta' [Vibrio sp. JC009]|uniref:DNA polymerase III subunit delta' n=1 Tax=Vibrio sp. JC009 TaxID=2912314 RepID=UPI0023AEC9C4|nr:DNA polymerase III subunit delta' [Vibrio sp. JC009]WED22689.1 DNA polymerase III subunit delta' [Vibrio sp. JC009]
MSDVYPWLKPVWQKWQQLSESSKIPGALLCSAAEGTGVSQIVSLLSRTLVCTHSNDEPCGFCHSCSLSETENHPDIHWIKPESQGKNITVDQIRECNRKALESSQLGGYRVIVISPAEAMNESASNALLKTLESPPEHCVFLLVSHNRAKLLPTIISRCQLWDIAEPDINVTYQWLQQNSKAAVSYNGIRLNRGAPLKSLAFFDNGEYEVFIELENRFAAEIGNPFPDTGKLFKLIKDNPLTGMFWLSVLLSDVQKVHFGLNEQGMCLKSQDIANVMSYQAAYDALIKLNKIREQLATYSGLNAELLFTNWILEICL